MSQNNQETQDNAKASAPRKEGARRRGKREENRSTRSFKHVTVDRTRPQLTKEGDGGAKGPARKKGHRQDFSSPKKDPNATLKVIPLGGLDAIGKNMTVRECKNDMILDDAGLMFPDDDHPGIDLILPD